MSDQSNAAPPRPPGESTQPETDEGTPLPMAQSAIVALTGSVKAVVRDRLNWLPHITTDGSRSEYPWTDGVPASAVESADRSQTRDRPATELTGLSESSETGEERVLILLDGYGGRMRQTEIVEGIDRSKGTVSQYLTRLEEREEIVKIPHGRENIIYRPEEVPEAVEPK